MHGWDWSVGEEHFKRAIELNPNYADAYISYGGLLNRLGRSNEAVAERKKGLALDPLSGPMTALLGRTLLLSRRYDEAIKQFQEALEMDPTFLVPRVNLVSAYWFNGMYEEAITQAEKVASLGGNQTRPVFLRQVASGNRADAMTTLENWVGLTPTGNAYRYAMLGEKDLAIDWMTTAIDEGYHNITTAKVNPFFDPIRDDPRFQDLLLRMNLEP